MEVKNLTIRVLEYIRNRIITGDLVPGQKLNENKLASRLEISRHPIREAFRVLETAGIKVITGVGGTIEEVIRKFKNGELQYAGGPNVEGHWV